jgi:hypothetical protein
LIGRVDLTLGFAGSEQDVLGALLEVVGNVRQRALVAEAGFPGTGAEVPMFAEAVLINEESGERTRVAAWHVDPTAPDADEWGIVDWRLPGEPMDQPSPDPPGPGGWMDGEAYVIGDEVVWNGKLYRCLQPHTSNFAAGWTPAVASLWSLI